MTSPLSIATDRFGLGAIPGEGPPAEFSVGLQGDMQRWLLVQLDRFDPAPADLGTRAERMSYLAVALSERAAYARTRRSGTPADQEAAQLRNRALMQESRQAYVAAVNARLGVAVESRQPFAERLVHFWSNHFAVSARKVRISTFAADFEFSAIRPNVLGNFRDLVRAAALHPAMLIYLDQNTSIGPSSTLASRARRSLGFNENLGRELLELHTLGVGGGYDQSDVTELALALTGWTVGGIGNARISRALDAAPGATGFLPTAHEPGARTVLGRRYGQAGAAQVEAIIADIAVHPATARHIATKLARHFFADQPPEASIARLERAFRDSDGNLPTVYAALVAEPAVWSAPREKIRSPWDWMVAATRAFGPDVLSRRRRGAANFLDLLGQPTWQVGSPAGWGDTAADWAGPGALMTRVEIANRIALAAGVSHDPRELAGAVLGDALRPSTRDAIAGSEQMPMGLALLLASPEFQRR